MAGTRSDSHEGVISLLSSDEDEVIDLLYDEPEPAESRQPAARAQITAPTAPSHEAPTMPESTPRKRARTSGTHVGGTVDRPHLPATPDNRGVLHRHYRAFNKTKLKALVSERKRDVDMIRTPEQQKQLKQTGSIDELICRLVEDDFATGAASELIPRLKEQAAQERTRARPWVHSRPSSVSKRLSRAQSQRLFLLDRSDGNTSSCRATFKVLGSTGNVYTVQVGNQPWCDCPDDNSHCKHLLFVYVKVLKMSPKDKLLYQNALVNYELDEIFANAPTDTRAVKASNDVLRAFHGAETPDKHEGGEDSETFCAATGVSRRQYAPNDDCPICYEEFGTEAIGWCKQQCGNVFHTRCMDMLCTHAKQNRQNSVCPLCRVGWHDATAGQTASPTVGSEGYVNLAAISGHTAERETDYDAGWMYGSRGYGGYRKYGGYRRRWR